MAVRLSVRRGHFNAPTRGRKDQVSKLDERFWGDRYTLPWEASVAKLSTRPAFRSTMARISESLSYNSDSVYPMALARRRKISWLGSASPRGSIAFTWAASVR